MHFTIKPVSYLCNLKCDYCFYLPKGSSGILPSGPKVMPDDVLEALVCNYIAACPGDTVYFTWQGGEPLLAGLDFYRQAFALQDKYALRYGKKVENAVQTNATLIDDEWCQLFPSTKCSWACRSTVLRRCMMPGVRIARVKAVGPR